MTIKTLFLPVEIKSKPRGQIGKYGNMTHSSKGYRAWQENTIAHIHKANIKPIKESLYSMHMMFNVSSKKKGRRNDLDNMGGAILDTLVESGILQIDDNWGCIPRLFLQARQVKAASHIEVFTTTNYAEMLYVFKKIYEKYPDT